MSYYKDIFTFSLTAAVRLLYVYLYTHMPLLSTYCKYMVDK